MARNRKLGVAGRFLAVLPLVTVAIAAPLEMHVQAGTGGNFNATGNVSNSNAPFPSGASTVEGENQAFILNPVTDGTAMTAGCQTGSSVEIFVTPSTTYYYAPNTSAPYQKVNSYSQVVVQGQSVSVVGRWVTTSAGKSQCVASTVWNPPVPGGTFTPAVTPQCNAPSSAHIGAYLMTGTVNANRVFAPCTGFGNNVGGFNVGKLSSYSEGVTGAVLGYGGNVDNYTTTTTTYVFGNQKSTWGQVVVPGHPVEVWGHYVHVNGGWLLTAKLVWTPPPNPSPSNSPRTLAGSSTVTQTAPGSGIYSGPSTCSNCDGMFGVATLQNNWTCSLDANGTDTDVTGGWKLFDGSGDSVSGTLTGVITNPTGASGQPSLNLGLDVNTGTGGYNASQGGGTFTGSSSPVSVAGSCPDGFSGNFTMSVVSNIT